jgi:hypothetical protein
MNTLPELHTGSLVLILAKPAVSSQLVTAFTARLALAGPVCVLDGGNCFAAYPLAREVRRCNAKEPIDEILGRIKVARAFTCYQMIALLAQTPEQPTPTLALELLTTFLDESVPLIERRYLLQHAVEHLVRISHQAPVAITNAPLTADQPGDLLLTLMDACDQIIHYENPPPPAIQLPLF